MATRTALSQVALPVAPALATEAATKGYMDGTFAKTSSLASITTPVTGQLALLTSDGKIYRYNGTAWRLLLGMGGRWRQDTTGQSIPATTDTKITFNTALETASGISYSAGVFTVLDAGKWHIEGATIYPYVMNLESWLWLGPSAATTTRWDLATRVSVNMSGPGAFLRVGITRTFTANETFALWTWQGSLTAKVLDIGYGGVTHLEATYRGPG